ncbi:UNVERIFIED_CONTAM: protein ENHANCED DISEASE RESISTANCE 2 [Sesamum calycinum]|uniref:Protein ENHANCED DISEASE RESISTANCE 2 n=1 Tax=Sesamum calycinum TaxID=2727403 RepID=A0AAW2LV39_9LAMI
MQSLRTMHVVCFNIVDRKRHGLIIVSKNYTVTDVESKDEPLRSAIIDSCIRVVDNGRGNHHKRLFFVFTLYNTSNHNDTLKLAATSSEEAARWIRSLQAAADPGKSLTYCSRRKYQPFRTTSLQRSERRRSEWEALDDHPAIMAIGVIDGTSEAVFHTLMSLGTSRTEWDFCFYKGSVVETLDGHTDIIHVQLYNHWLPWAMKRRDFLLRRYWRREDDGTYVILYHSVVHKKCPPRSGYVRACLKTLSEMFRAKAGNLSHDFLSGDLPIDIAIPESEKEEIKTEVSLNRIQKKIDNETPRQRSGASSLVGLNDSDEFFDVPEPSDDDLLENGWSSNTVPESFYVDKYQQKLSSAATLVKNCRVLQSRKRVMLTCKGYPGKKVCQAVMAPHCRKIQLLTPPVVGRHPILPRSFRGANYLEDHQKITAKGTLMQMVAADWLRSDKREDDLAGRPGSIVQVPGSTTYNLALYYMLKTPLQETPLLEHFVNGDNAFRNSRFKLIPYISKGSWIVKQSVGRKACLVGQALEINYFRGTNYLELGVDIGSSTVARGVVSLVLGPQHLVMKWHSDIKSAYLLISMKFHQLTRYLM